MLLPLSRLGEVKLSGYLINDSETAVQETAEVSIVLLWQNPPRWCCSQSTLALGGSPTFLLQPLGGILGHRKTRGTFWPAITWHFTLQKTWKLNWDLRLGKTWLKHLWFGSCFTTSHWYHKVLFVAERAYLKTKVLLTRICTHFYTPIVIIIWL